MPPNAELAVIGKPHPRLNGRAKVTGAIRYTADIAPQGLLIGRILRSPHAHAQVRAIDTSAVERDPRVRAIVRAINIGDPAHSVVRYVGQPAVAIAATSMSAAEDALRLIRIDFRPLPFVLDIHEARRPELAKVYDAASAPGNSVGEIVAQIGLPLEGNVRGPAQARRGDVAQGFANAAVVVEGEYRTQVQTHCCMEPHGLVADWRPDGLTVYMSTQYTTGVRRELAKAFDLPLEKVRVVVDGMGGGFGSKSTLGNYGRLAVALSRQANAPVRLTLTRPEEQVDSGNRPATDQRIRIGARRDGSLTAVSVESHGTAGVGLGTGIGNFAQSLYECPNFESAQYDVFTNAGPGSAMRGPGNTPGAWGMETAIDELAERLALDPLELRERIDPSPVRREERRIGAEKFGWSSRHSPGADPGPIKRGMGMAQSLCGANVQTASSIEVRIHRDGSVEALSDVQDIGSGIGVVIAQTIAEVLGLTPDWITVRIGDTRYPPWAPLLRQSDDSLDHAAGACRGLEASTATAGRDGAGAQRGAGRARRAQRKGRNARRAEARHELHRCGGADQRGYAVRYRNPKRGLRGFPPDNGRGCARAAGYRRRTVRRSRGRYRDWHHPSSSGSWRSRTADGR